MREKARKIKQKLDERMEQKSRRQIIWYNIFSGIIFLMEYIRILLKLKGNTIVVCLIGVMYCFVVIVIETYLIGHLILANQREYVRSQKRKKTELFETTKYLKVIPSETAGDIYREILGILEEKTNERFFKSIRDYTIQNCKKSINQMLEKDQISFTAELINEDICIAIRYQKEYYPNELRNSNYRWFELNFSIVK